VNGKYAIAAITFQLEDKDSYACKLKVWNSIERIYVDDLAANKGL
jgi:hypothetical protein